MNPIILPPTMGRLGWSALEKENSELKPVKLGLKIDPVSYPARAEGLVNMIEEDGEKEKDIGVGKRKIRVQRWTKKKRSVTEERSSGRIWERGV